MRDSLTQHMKETHMRTFTNKIMWLMAVIRALPDAFDAAYPLDKNSFEEKLQGLYISAGNGAIA